MNTLSKRQAKKLRQENSMKYHCEEILKSLDCPVNIGNLFYDFGEFKVLCTIAEKYMPPSFIISKKLSSDFNALAYYKPVHLYFYFENNLSKVSCLESDEKIHHSKLKEMRKDAIFLANVDWPIYHIKLPSNANSKRDK